MDEITKFSVLDGKTEFTILDEKWANDQPIAGKIVKIDYSLAENSNYTMLLIQLSLFSRRKW